MKRIVSLVLVSVLTMMSVLPIYAEETRVIPDEIINIQEETGINVFRNKVMAAGLALAQRTNKILSEREMKIVEQSDNVMKNNIGLRSDYQTKEMERINFKKISMDDIYNEYPSLLKEGLANNYFEQDPTLAPVSIGASSMRSSTSYGTYRLLNEVKFGATSDVDDQGASDYDELAQFFISIASIGMTPAQSVFTTIMLPAFSSSEIQNSTGIFITTRKYNVYRSASGQVYQSGGLLNDDKWWTYVLATHREVWASATASAYINNRFEEEHSDTVRVEYWYDLDYYNPSYLSSCAISNYNKAYNDTYTSTYGVLPVMPTYETSKDVHWIDSGNPF